MITKTAKRGWGRDFVIIAVALGLGLIASEAFGQDRPSRKVIRQINVMEKIIDQMLLDSPNLLIFGSDVTRGIYIEDFGCIFSFDASLVDKGDHHWDWKNFGFRVERDDDGRVVIIGPGDDEDSEDYETHEGPDSRDLERRFRDRGVEMEERLYKAGKAEIVETLLDYGDTMTSLKKGEFVTIAAALRDTNFFDRRNISRLVLKVKIDDLRAYTAGDLSEEETVRRIQMEEY